MAWDSSTRKPAYDRNAGGPRCVRGCGAASVGTREGGPLDLSVGPLQGWSLGNGLQGPGGQRVISASPGTAGGKGHDAPGCLGRDSRASKPNFDPRR